MFEPGVRYVSERHIVIDKNPTPVPFWNPNLNLYLEKTIVIIGGGPSHSDLDLSLLGNFNFIAINSSCRKVKEIAKKNDILYFSDNSWSEHCPNLITTWSGIVVTSNRNSKARLGDLVNRLDIQNLTEFMKIKSDYVQASSGHTATCLGVYLGAKRIILIGFESDKSAKRTHGHNDYSQSDLNAFEERFLQGWTGLWKRFRELGCEIINSTPNSMIKEFEFMSLEKALGF